MPRTHIYARCDRCRAQFRTTRKGAKNANQTSVIRTTFFQKRKKKKQEKDASGDNRKDCPAQVSAVGQNLLDGTMASYKQSKLYCTLDAEAGGRIGPKIQGHPCPRQGRRLFYETAWTP